MCIRDRFTNITVNKVIKLINDNNMGEYMYKKQLMKVIKECVNQNYFRFKMCIRDSGKTNILPMLLL